jgi:aminobenzoyl-glutamate transport protein
MVGLLAWAVIPDGALLRDPATGGLLRSPFLSGIVMIIVILFWVPGVVYGLLTRTVRNDSDAVRMMAKAMSGMGSYLVLVFFAAQFVAYFAWTNIGLVTAIEGASFLRDVGLTGVALMLVFVLFTAVINLAISSASAKWAVMAPVFVPMFMLLGYTPELTQAAYRIADSSTNIITPMLSYYPLIIALAQKYRPDAGIGTLVATMLPYSLMFLVVWSALLGVWMLIGIPVGPGAELNLAP